MAGPIPTRKPRRRVINVRALVHAFDGAERPYPYYTFSARRFFGRVRPQTFDLVSLTLVSGSIPTGAVGTPYSGLNWSSSNGTVPFRWSIIAGTLPPGLTLNFDTGSISGTPTAAGVYTYTIQATGNPVRGTEVGSLASSITVNP